MNICLIRHGITQGNTMGRYIGITDEPLCPQGIALLKERNYPPARRIYISPLKRCMMTAQILYPGQEYVIQADMAECDFGMFENKNYQELKDTPLYQQWIDSNGAMPFPGGESQESFRSRCVRGFVTAVEDAIENHISQAAMVVHGGTIMAVLERFAVPHRNFYDWHVKNGCGYEITLDEEMWKKGKKEVTVRRKLDFEKKNRSKT